MSDDQRFGQTQGQSQGGQRQGSQTGTDTDGRSAEYRDGLTVQDESQPAGSSEIDQPSTDFNDTATGAHTGGTGAATTGAWSTDNDRTSTTASGTSGGFGSGATDNTLGGGSTGSAGGTGSSYGTTGSTSGLGSRDTETDLTTGSDYGSARSGGREIGDNTDGLGRDQTDQVTADETGTLISADKVQGTAVYDGTGERLGTIDSLMLNKRSGKVAYAVMSFGGFLGIGERYHPLPWDKLMYDVDKGGYNVGATQDELRSGPAYSRDELDDFGDNGRRDEVDDYYGRSALEGGLTRSGGIPIV